MEKMLAHQLAAGHEMAMRYADRALSYGTDSVESCRYANTSARFMSVYQEGLITLQRLRTGGNQTVTVQHVNVQPGGQAVIGNVHTGGANRRGGNGKSG